MSELPKGWVETTLGEVVETNTSSINKNYKYNEIYYLDTGSITLGKIDSLQLLLLKDAPSRAKRLVKNNSIVYSTVRPIQRHYGIIINPAVNLVVSTGFTVIDSIENKSNNTFIYYFLTANKIVQKLDMIANGTVSTYPSIKPIDIESLSINLPPLPEQKAIANILSAFDEKIKLLREQNKTLETLAQTIFKEWFVNFNYPGATGEMIDSELGKIPLGWRVEQLGKELEVKRGGSPRPIKDYVSDSGYRWLKISDATASISPFIFEIKEYIKKEGLRKTTLLKAGSLVLSNSATPGIPKFLEVDSCIHDGWLHFPKTSIFSYQYLYLFFKHIRNPLLQQGNGSVFKNLKTDILKSWKMAIPDVETMKNFDELISPIFKKIKNNTVQIQTLAKTRDTLLPKLMSGEIRVKGF